MSDDLDELIHRNDPDRWLSSRFVADEAARADVIVLYAFDHELARAPKVATSSLLGEIRLTWWREMLDEVFEGRPVRQHPTAQALGEMVQRRGLDRGPLEAMIDGRYRELDATPMTEGEALDWARDTGGQCAQAAALILDPASDAEFALAPGSAWALGRKVRSAKELKPAFEKVLATARTAARHLSPAAFPAVAHAALVIKPPRSEVGRRMRLTLAVARGRI